MVDVTLTKFAEMLGQLEIFSSTTSNYCITNCTLEQRQDWNTALTSLTCNSSLISIASQALLDIMSHLFEPHINSVRRVIHNNSSDALLIHALIDLYRFYALYVELFHEWSTALGSYWLVEAFQTRLRVSLLRKQLEEPTLMFESEETSNKVDSECNEEEEHDNEREMEFSTYSESWCCKTRLMQLACTHAHRLLLDKNRGNNDDLEINATHCSTSNYCECHCLSCKVETILKCESFTQWLQCHRFLFEMQLRYNKLSLCVIYILSSLTLCASEDMKPVWMEFFHLCIHEKLYQETEIDDEDNSCNDANGIKQNIEWLTHVVVPFIEIVILSPPQPELQPLSLTTKSSSSPSSQTASVRENFSNSKEHEHSKETTSFANHRHSMYRENIKNNLCKVHSQSHMLRRWLLNTLFVEFIRKQLSVIWEIVIEFPDSLQAVKDVRYCLQHSMENSMLKTEITSTVQEVLASRLHKAGTRTEDIVSVLNKTIEVLALLVTRNERALFVERTIHATLIHLQHREDCVATIVKVITESNEHANSWYDVEVTEEESNEMDLFSGNAIVDENVCNISCIRQKQIIEKDDDEIELCSENEEKWKWKGDNYSCNTQTYYDNANKEQGCNNLCNECSNAISLFRSYDDIKKDLLCTSDKTHDARSFASNKPPDVLHILLSTLSTKVIAEEYKRALATQLLSKHFCNFDITLQEEVLERLKCVLGELVLLTCTIMLHDIQSSRRLTTQLREQIALHYGESTMTQPAECKQRQELKLAREESAQLITPNANNVNTNDVNTTVNIITQKGEDDSDTDSFIGRHTVCLDNTYVLPSSSLQVTSSSEHTTTPMITTINNNNNNNASDIAVDDTGDSNNDSKPTYAHVQSHENNNLTIPDINSECISVTIISATAWPEAIVQAGLAPISRINHNAFTHNITESNRGISHNFSSSMKDNMPPCESVVANNTLPFNIHPLLLNKMNELARAYRAVKAMRKLEWMYNYGCIQMEITQWEALSHAPITTSVELSLFETSIVLYVQDAEIAFMKSRCRSKCQEREQTYNQFCEEEEEEEWEQEQEEQKEHNSHEWEGERRNNKTSIFAYESRKNKFAGISVERLSRLLNVSLEELLLRLQPLLIHILVQTEHGIAMQTVASDTPNVIVARVDNEHALTAEEQKNELPLSDSHTPTDNDKVSNLYSSTTTTTAAATANNKSNANNGSNHGSSNSGVIAGLTLEQMNLLQTMITAMIKAGGPKSINDIYNSMKLFGQFKGTINDMRKVLQHLLTTNIIALSADNKNYYLP